MKYDYPETKVRYNRDGQRCSASVRMWIFHLQGLRSDLYQNCSSTVAQSMLTSVLSDTLNILVTRYYQIVPSEVRLPFYRGDVLLILAAVASFLPSVVHKPQQCK